MRGSIISYTRNKGLISGADNNRYEFTRLDWSGQGEPAAGIKVDFVAEGAIAKNIFPLSIDSKHSKVVMAIVCWFFGIFGVHRFMVGKIGTGVLMLLLTVTVIGSIISFIWSIIDFILILMGKFKDKDGNPITSEYL
ncbi:TM2 domain-containing protein [Bartonella apihabitans]|uniref:TM2 domain-containing protein n=1 Tax=Bartonella apihabitans TaxID=2750929 RepID=A0A1U9MAT7_9HYPH|nr:TM2 domain-containing protein [Bartonella apihabitans]AQT42406.1 TM2 domain-containing protein [Bartonella apihabitans]MBI0019506.1 TM2 domain-containing protein [Bartonella apihabitans]MBI0167227.1 TM2 domain-containing protein [Bartonella apihabitans]